MKTIRLNILNILTVALIWLIQGCSREPILNADGTGGLGSPESITMVMTLNIPGMAATRGLTPTQEETINNIDVFVFDKDLKLTDWQYGQLANNSGVVSFSAILQASRDNNDKFRIMVLANARRVTYDLFSGSDFGGRRGDSYSEVCTALKTTVPTYSGLVLEGIPMWGEVEDMILLNSANSTYHIDLLRSLARIDVGTNANPSYTPSGQITGWTKLPNFSLEEVFVYNANTHYALAADRANYDFAGKRIDTYSLPETTTKGEPKAYSDTQTPGTVDRDGEVGVSVTGTIYTGEADVKMDGTYGDSNHPNRMALVVMGYYTPPGESANTTVPSYYRLDFIESMEHSALMDILRNRDFQIVIKAVNGAGSTTKEEAFRKQSDEIEVAVISWIPANQGSTVVDGQNYLSVSTHDLVMGKWSVSDTRFLIKTNQAGWSAKILNPSDTWIQLRNVSSGIVSPVIKGASDDELRFSIDEIPASVTERLAQIRVTAGKMNLDVMVKQTDQDQEFMLRLSHSELNFTGRKWDAATKVWTQPDPQELRISYGPTLHNYTMNLIAFLGGGVSGITLPSPPASNLMNMTIQPEAIDSKNSEVKSDPFYVRSSRLAFTVKNVDGSETVTKTVFIKQTFYSLLLTGTFDYYMQGQTYVLKVRANAPWKAVYSGDKSIFSSHSNTGGSGITASKGETFKFTIAPNATPDAVAYITFSSPTDLFPPQKIKISAQDMLPNSYIVSPGGYVDIPVRKAYRIWELDRDLRKNLTKLSGVRNVELLWQDTWDGTKGIIKSVGKLTSATGKEKDAVFRVATNNLSPGGNAVVAFKIGNVVYWSWHIWVTKYKPETQNITYSTFTLMDRNLGAMNNQPPANNNDVSSHGFFYQGGRKDPWIGQSGFVSPNNAKVRPQYDIKGKIVTVNSTKPSPVGVNLAGAINQPLTYYLGSYGNTSWYGAFKSMRNDFWINNDRKGDFDPCPAGWTVPNNKLYLNSGIPKQATRGVMLAGSYFPSAGRRSYTYEIGHFGTAPLLWSTNRNKSHPIYRFDTSGVNSYNSSSRSAFAASMRCVKE